MKKESRFLAFALMGIAAVGIGYANYRMVTAGYFSHNPFTGAVVMVLSLFALASLLRWGRHLSRLSVLWLPIAILFLEGCSYAKSNQQVVVSGDCGVTWERIKAGEAVPRKGVNPCYMKVVIPNYPMQGESRFITNLKDKVRTVTHIDYDYTIVEPLAFIQQAKFLGKANTDADDEAAIGTNFEGAENMVIDKRIKDVAKALFVNEDIVELDQSELEDRLLDESNKLLKPLGIQLNFITLTFDLDEQTRQAIDIATAMKIYQSRDLVEVGKEVMKERAGATKIVVENRTEQAAKPE
jgi:hypothetical protein